MYYYIKGTLAEKGDGFIVVDAGGVGYQLFASMSTVSAIGGIGDFVTAYAYLYIREGIMDLYGFCSLEEKTMFLQLIGISGVGPKAALSVLSVAPPSKLALAVITDDYKLIQTAQGIGAKTAQRIILELKDKLKNTDLGAAVSESVSGAETVAENDNRAEAVSALMVLGYSDREAAAALSGLDASLDTEELIKLALKNMI